MIGYTKLSKEVDNHLKKQAQLDEKSEKIVDRFLKQHTKPEIYGLIDFVITSGAPKHSEAIEEFKVSYEENHLSVKDIKVYLDIFDIHKDRMKQPKDNELSNRNRAESELGGE